jgi:hypothetical protein
MRRWGRSLVPDQADVDQDAVRRLGILVDAITSDR